MMKFVAALFAALAVASVAHADGMAPGYCYSNNGLSWRTCDSTAPIQAGEVWFATPANPTQLGAAFVSYSAAASAQTATLASVQAFNQALAAGVQVTSQSNPGINGTYAFDPTTRANIQAVIVGVIAARAGVIAGSGLPGGASTFLFPDASQVEHSFDVPTFIAFALGIEGYYYAISIGQTPAQPVQLP